jgi:hypothetical protein
MADEDEDDYKETNFKIFEIYPAFIRIENYINPDWIGIYSLYSSEDDKLKYINENGIEFNLDILDKEPWNKFKTFYEESLRALEFNVYTERYVNILEFGISEDLVKFLINANEAASTENKEENSEIGKDVGTIRYVIPEPTSLQDKQLVRRSLSFEFGNVNTLFGIFSNTMYTKVSFVKRPIHKKNEDSGTKRTIDITNLETFNKNIGVGGVAMLFRYFQFLDSVHDLCETGRGPWGNKINRHSVYKKLGDIYADDIKYMLNKDYITQQNKRKKLWPNFTTADKLENFLKYICLKPIGNGDIDSIKFYNYTFKKTENNPPVTDEPLGNYIPNTKTMDEKIIYLLGEYLSIDKISPSGNRACSDSLYLGVKQIFGYNTAPTLYYVPGTTEIVYHIDAESNKTKVCGIMQRICDFVSDKPLLSNNIVKYSPNAITSEYDAAWAQASSSYISNLEKIQGTRKTITEESSPSSLNLILKCHDVVLMNISYRRTTAKLINISFALFIKCITNAAYKNILNNDIPIKILKLIIPIFHQEANPFVNSLPQIVDPDNINEATDYVKKLRKLYNANPKKITQQNLQDIYNSGVLKLPDIEGLSKVVTLTINRMYNYTGNDFTHIPGAINPLLASDDSDYWLRGNQNLSFTSSLNAVTKGEHYLSSVKVVGSKDVEKAATKKICLRGWFKSLGDLGQILEFHTKTRHTNPSMSYMPIFLTFDRLCANISVFFNPLTILEDKKEKTGLTFYKKTGIFGFGKVNNQMHNKQMYNRRRYNISKRLKLMTESELKNKLKSVGIKITKNLRGKRKYLTRKELENKALLFNKLQNTAKRIKIKIMYKSRNGLYKYKTYKRLQKEINSKYKINRKYKKPLVRNFNFG